MEAKWDAESYAKNSKSQELWAKELIEKINLNGHEVILDIGCGDGKVTDYLAHLTTSRVVGIDLNHDMIALAKASYPLPEFLQMDAEKIDYENTFDLVFSNAVLHWVKNHEAVIAGIHKALKPKGKTVLQMGGEGNAKMVFTALSTVQKEYAPYFEDFVSPYTFCSDSYYLKILDKAGFVQPDVQLIEKDMVHKNLEAFEGWLKTTWFPYLGCLPENKRVEFLNQWIQAYLDLAPLDKMGRVHVSMVRLEVKAQKK
ncbi:MAG: methyltransferase domain-containing protein [Sulfuricurvum sp.]|jgi:trans-aconitate methyltransferase|uniref:class I SAM-dependent methyltransferase n=1 Tax=Sulfuricurvum sp. TaxID=2025608 RepID=UPI0025D5BF3F|nr:class I SAM-dependent methyltransferase [Sulfuricurvum sp.]MCK9372795.1 methyltransferase domain-containing protein [Sulfuricurvum sp.]